MTFSDITQGHLDKVLMLQKAKTAALSTVRKTKYKRIGLYHIEISDEEKAVLRQKVNRHYDSAIAAEYDTMNKALIEAGQPTINNPFTGKED